MQGVDLNVSDDFSVTPQLGYISIRVSDSPDIRDHTIHDECASYHNATFPEASSMTFVCNKVMYGSYLSIQRTRGFHYYHLALCEVEVSGRPICEHCNIRLKDILTFLHSWRLTGILQTT